MTTGDRIRKLRETSGISQTELARKADISKQTLYKYEMNIVTNIPSDKIETIAEILDVSPAHLMGWPEQHINNQSRILTYYNMLNAVGKQAAVKCVEKLAGISEYTASSTPVLNAAHRSTDIVIPGDTDTTDNDIMNDDNF